MNALFFIRQNFKEIFFKDKMVDEVNYKRILPYFSVISNNINASQLDDLTINKIKYEIINFLNYDQLDYLLESILQQDKKEIIKKYGNIEFKKALKITSLSYGVGLLIWCIFIVFLQLQFS